MKRIDLSAGAVSLKNLAARPTRTACLVVVSAVLAFALFGGSLLAMNLRQGLAAMTRRFGADLMVVPRGSAGKAQSLLLRGGTGYFYFDSRIAGSVAETAGVVCASPQFFLTSLSESCCDAMVQLIAFDPETDFVVQPWVAEKYKAKIQDGQVVTGSGISIRADGTVRLLGRFYPVAARLSKSAGGLDTSIFMTMNTMRELAGQARTDGYTFLETQEKELARGRVSAVLVKTARTESPSRVAAAIQKQNEDVEVLVSQTIFGAIADSLAGLVKYIHIFSAALWVLAVVVLAAVFSGIIHERKKEFALLRILGATRTKILRIALGESAIAGAGGGAAGIVLASLAVFPFSTLISERLALPYLDAPPADIILLALGCLLLSAIAGPLASLYAALRISKAETYFTLREGE